MVRARSGLVARALADGALIAPLEAYARWAGGIGFPRLRRLYFGAYEPKGGAVEHGPHLFDQPTTHHRPEIYGGIEERRAGELLRGFFRNRRQAGREPLWWCRSGR